MNEKLLAKCLPSILQSKKKIEISVVGISMNPTLVEGDVVTIEQSDEYKKGDIIVFNYKNEGLLIHRLVKLDFRCFCKGDNAFRLEDITYNQIIGKAVLVNGKPIEPWDEWKIDLSYAVNREFFKAHYDKEKTKKTAVYKLYASLILREEEFTMKYKKTNKMDYILADETSLAVFDPESGNTYFFDEPGIDIFNCLEEPCDLTILLNRLCVIYSATPTEIKEDVEEFLADVVSKGIVELV